MRLGVNPALTHEQFKEIAYKWGRLPNKGFGERLYLFGYPAFFMDDYILVFRRCSYCREIDLDLEREQCNRCQAPIDWQEKFWVDNWQDIFKCV